MVPTSCGLSTLKQSQMIAKRISNASNHIMVTISQSINTFQHSLLPIKPSNRWLLLHYHFDSSIIPGTSNPPWGWNHPCQVFSPVEKIQHILFLSLLLSTLHVCYDAKLLFPIPHLSACSNIFNHHQTEKLGILYFLICIFYRCNLNLKSRPLSNWFHDPRNQLLDSVFKPIEIMLMRKKLQKHLFSLIKQLDDKDIWRAPKLARVATNYSGWKRIRSRYYDLFSLKKSFSEFQWDQYNILDYRTIFHVL